MYMYMYMHAGGQAGAVLGEGVERRLAVGCMWWFCLFWGLGENGRGQ